MSGKELYDKLKQNMVTIAHANGHMALDIVDWSQVGMFQEGYERVAAELSDHQLRSDEALGKLSWSEQHQLYKRLYTMGHRIY